LLGILKPLSLFDYLRRALRRIEAQRFVAGPVFSTPVKINFALFFSGFALGARGRSPEIHICGSDFHGCAGKSTVPSSGNIAP
jgi:hypothetical protein